MKDFAALTLVMAVGLSACAETTSMEGADPITAGISGKTLSNDGGDIVVGSDGSLGGMVGSNRDIAVKGAWTVRDGQFCRTIEEPANVAGTECQDVAFNDDGTVTFKAARGDQTYTVN